jgi:hypothetical protein
MMQIRDTRGYNHIDGHHGIPGSHRVHGERFVVTEPNGRLFLPWHRAYLYIFELYVQDAGGNNEITVPWWDWTSDLSRSEGIPKALIGLPMEALIPFTAIILMCLNLSHQDDH